MVAIRRFFLTSEEEEYRRETAEVTEDFSVEKARSLMLATQKEGRWGVSHGGHGGNGGHGGFDGPGFLASSP
jgi:hypothetical protein